MSSEHSPDQCEVDKHNELYLALRTRILAHSRLLLLEAVQRDHLSEDESRRKALFFAARFVTNAPLASPGEDTLAILLTPNGENLLPSRLSPHFFVYFNNQPGVLDMRTPLKAVGITSISEAGTQSIIVNETDVYPFPEDEASDDHSAPADNHIEIPDGTGVLSFPAPPTVPYAEVRVLFEELQAYKVAPQAYGPLSP